MWVGCDHNLFIMAAQSWVVTAMGNHICFLPVSYSAEDNDYGKISDKENIRWLILAYSINIGMSPQNTVT